MALAIKHFYRFGDFTVDTDQKMLLREGKRLPLTPKVFDTLQILVQNSGRLVQKEELMNRLWPHSFVEEANLTSNIKQLRKTLGDNARQPRYIETVARRGYRFIAEVEEVFKDSRTIGQQFSHRFPTPDSQATTVDHGFLGDERQNAALWLASPTAGAVELTAAQVSPISAGGSRLKTSRRRFFGLMAILVVVLASGIFVWRISNRRNEKLGEFMAELPLKIERLTATGQSKYAAISPDGKYLAYTSGFENKQSIWLRQLVTNTNVEIVPAETIIYGLAFDNSGEYVYFVKGHPTALYRVSLLGGVATKIVDGLQGKFSISPDDRHIAFVRQPISRNGEPQEYFLNISDSDGSAERTLLTTKHPDRLDAPIWSPDGESIICTYGNPGSGSPTIGLVEVRVSDGMKRELSTEKFANINRIAWLPHQVGLIMSATRGVDDYRQLWRVSYPAMEFRQITVGSITYSDLSVTANGAELAASQTTRVSDLWVGESRELKNFSRITPALGNLCWTPDRRLVYSSRASGSNDLWIMRPDGSEQRQLTVNAGSNVTPAVTPDNRYIVFISTRTGGQVWRMNMDGSNQVQLTSGGGKNFTAISADGKWVLYNTTDDLYLWKVSIDGGEPVRVTDYPAYFPSVSPDGKMIACVGRGESSAAILIVTFDGGQRVKSFDLTRGDFPVNRVAWTPDGQDLIYPIERDGVTTLVKKTLNGGKAEEIMKFDDELFDFGYSPDGQMLAVTRGGWQHDIFLISDLR